MNSFLHRRYCWFQYLAWSLQQQWQAQTAVGGLPLLIQEDEQSIGNLHLCQDGGDEESKETTDECKNGKR